jgi:hypothetical protein
MVIFGKTDAKCCTCEEAVSVTVTVQSTIHVMPFDIRHFAVYYNHGDIRG